MAPATSLPPTDHEYTLLAVAPPGKEHRDLAALLCTLTEWEAEDPRIRKTAGSFIIDFANHFAKLKMERLPPAALRAATGSALYKISVRSSMPRHLDTLRASLVKMLRSSLCGCTAVAVLRDTLSEEIALRIYPHIAAVETRLRGLLHLYNLEHRGPGWLDEMNQVFRNRAKERRGTLQKEDKALDELQDSDLHHLNFSDLGELIYNPYYTFQVQKNLFEGLDAVQTTEELAAYKEALSREPAYKLVRHMDLSRFKHYWERLYYWRNKVAHNGAFRIGEVDAFIKTLERINPQLVALEEALAARTPAAPGLPADGLAGLFEPIVVTAAAPDSSPLVAEEIVEQTTAEGASAEESDAEAVPVHEAAAAGLPASAETLVLPAAEPAASPPAAAKARPEDYARALKDVVFTGRALQDPNKLAALQRSLAEDGGADAMPEAVVDILERHPKALKDILARLQRSLDFTHNRGLKFLYQDHFINYQLGDNRFYLSEGELLDVIDYLEDEGALLIREQALKTDEGYLRRYSIEIEPRRAREMKLM